MTLGQILQLGDACYFLNFFFLFPRVMRREKGGKKGKKKMDEREKEVGDVEGRTEMTDERVRGDD